MAGTKFLKLGLMRVQSKSSVKANSLIAVAEGVFQNSVRNSSSVKSISEDVMFARKLPSDVTGSSIIRSDGFECSVGRFERFVEYSQRNWRSKQREQLGLS